MVRNAPEVLGHLQTALHDWAPLWRKARAEPDAVSILQGEGRDFTITSEFLDEPLVVNSAASALCGVIADMAQCWIEDRPGEVALHAGGLIVNGLAIAFAGEARAGKSTLMARLTAEPWGRVLCDDVLPLTPSGEAMGLGIPPRLRLPLPPGSSQIFRDHVARHAGPRDRRYAYLAALQVAAHGTCAPLAAYVILTRRPGASASLHAVDPADRMTEILTRNMADPGSDGRLLDRVGQLANKVRMLRLVYSDLEEAVGLIRRVFGAATFPEDEVLPALPSESLTETRPAQEVAPDVVWTRSDGVGLRRQGGSVFLWQASDNAVFQMNTVAAAIWNLLEEPESAKGIAATLAVAFPDTAAETILADSRLLLGELAAADLIRPVP
ncbi:MAG: PqqD family protein [Rubellimicrobium sp.]|nr:PqqD family protein [Rubellimicrobium sp.]